MTVTLEAESALISNKPLLPTRLNTQNLAITVPAKKGGKTPDPLLQDELAAYRQRHDDLSDKELGARLGFSATYVFRYFKNDFQGDLVKFEAAIRELLRQDVVRDSAIQTVQPFSTLATRQLDKYFTAISRKPQIGIIYGDAGVGKTSGISLYREDNNLALHVDVNRVNGTGPHALVYSLWNQLDSRGFEKWRKSTGGGKRGTFIMRALRGSNRLLILDNAHRLSAAGRQWICDFHDFTGCPVALVGNKEILDDWKTNDQQFSRCGFMDEVKLIKRTGADKESTLRDAVATFLQHVWPEAAKDLFDLALFVASKHGYLRALWHQISQAQYLIENKATTDPVAAFRSAHAQLVRNYQLPA